ncbi:MAG: DegT/DnrJ/EryC1/StrS family aminotransferase [Spirochaetaceae bacterium]|jgi:dTDP-4-amino-4,6-dideoxygalactose transaminase|nr:DegT/DnrJ/EryC1/StrS family aminotransferase [Spirochaetaceae bacterium]
MEINSDSIPFARPFIGREEEEAVLRVLRSGWLTTGEEALNFEKEFAALLEKNTPGLNLKALAVNSATSGLHLALEAAGVKQGDIVLVPSLTFASTAEIARYLGAEVAFVDVCKNSFLIDPNALEDTVQRLKNGKRAYPQKGPKGRVKALIPVHFGGLPCDMDAIMQIAAKYELTVIEDSAHALPAKLACGAYAGTAGDMGVYSFYATKTITTGEGGMVVSSNPSYTERMATMRLHGIDRPVWNRYSGEGSASWYYEVKEAGYKYNMPDLLACIGRAQLKRVFDLLEMRRAIAERYDAAFSQDERFLTPPSCSEDARHLYPLRLNTAFAGKRDEFSCRLRKAGVCVSVHFIPLHIMPYYKQRYGLDKNDFPETMRAFSAEISLPIWPGMNNAQVERVITVVKDVCR